MRLTSFARHRMLAGLAVLAGMTGGGAVLAQPAIPTADVKIDKTGALLVPLGELHKKHAAERWPAPPKLSVSYTVMTTDECERL